MKRANFFQAKPIQALVSGWAIAAIFWLLILPLAKDAPQMVITWFFAIATFLCGGLAAVRLPRPAGKLRHNWLPEMGYALGLTVGLAILTLVIMKITGHPDLVDRSYFGKGSVILIVFLCAPGFLLSRVVMRGLWAWNDLRKTHFIWDLTHSIFIVAAAVGFLAILITYIIWFKPGDIPAFTASTMISRTIIWSLTMLIVSIGLVIGILILISPFAIGFSYLVARRITRRIDTLSQATITLRSGDLNTRTPVEGQDEIALLQTNFNRMAIDLQSSTEALKEEKEKVASLLQSQRELSAGISHELRTPVATIIGSIDELQRHWHELTLQQVNQRLQAVGYESNRMKSILNDMLTISQTEANHLSVHLEAVDVENLITAIVGRVGPLVWDLKRIQITASTQAGLAHALADPERLEQVLINLIQNGVRHTPPGGGITVNAITPPDHSSSVIWLEVSDTGEGIASADLPHIWEKYYQANSSQKGSASFKDGGFGLGLSIVKELVEGMGGRIQVESTLGEGCTFRVELPVFPKTATQL
jgi:signal transduction histidine kinase